MMIGLRSDPEATLFLTCRRAACLLVFLAFVLAYIVPMVHPGATYVICTGQNATIRPGCDVVGKAVREGQPVEDSEPRKPGTSV
jgi:hypothetical protein